MENGQKSDCRLLCTSYILWVYSERVYTMATANEALDYLITQISTIIASTKTSEELMLSTKAATTALNTQVINESWLNIKQNIFLLIDNFKTDDIEWFVIRKTFVLFIKIINETESIMDLMLVAKSLQFLVNSISEIIKLVDSKEAPSQLSQVERKVKEITDQLISKLTLIADKIDNPEAGLFASKIVLDIDKAQRSLKTVPLHFLSLEQLNIKIDALVNELKIDINNLSITVDVVFNQIASVIEVISKHTINFNNPHNVTKVQIGLSNVENFTSTSSVIDTSESKFSTAKATNIVWEKVVAVKNDLDPIITSISTHVEDFTNPHKVTKSQVGLSNVNNYTISTDVTDPSETKFASISAVKQAWDRANLVGDGGDGLNKILLEHLDDFINPHRVSKSQVGLANVADFTATSSTTDAAENKYATAKAVKTVWDKVSSVDNDVSSLTTTIYNHTVNYSNPHKVTKAQVSLSNVPNYPAVNSVTDSSSAKFAVAASVKTTYDKAKSVEGSLNTHKGDYNNPHKVTKAQVSLSNVNNWVASSSVTDSSTAKYATAGAVKTAYDKTIAVENELDDLAGNFTAHTVNYSNPHKVTKAQVSLSNVPNYAITSSATDSSDNKFASAKAVKTAWDFTIAVELELNAHSVNYNNPHKVTKAQVGLSNVPNYVITSSVTDVSESKFASAKGVKTAYDRANSVASDTDEKLNSHLSNFSNPHKVTKAQVGLSSVNNWSATSSVSDSSNSKYATAGAVKQAYDKANEARLLAVPVGTIIYWPVAYAPSGFLTANGALISRSSYWDLFNTIGTIYGVGNGSSTFRIPDARGFFLRADGSGSGVDTGRLFGTTQGDAIRNITGNFISAGGGGGAITASPNQHLLDGGNDMWFGSATFDASRVVPTAVENRPININFLVCIKY